MVFCPEKMFPAKLLHQLKCWVIYVFRTDFGADITIMEEVTELITRIKTGGVLPMITSCCPGWINYAELNYPSLFDNISSCKSPQQMLGALIKTILERITYIT